jgi:hypothetical protein
VFWDENEKSATMDALREDVVVFGVPPAFASALVVHIGVGEGLRGNCLSRPKTYASSGIHEKIRPSISVFRSLREFSVFSVSLLAELLARLG